MYCLQLISATHHHPHPRSTKRLHPNPARHTTASIQIATPHPRLHPDLPVTKPPPPPLCNHHRHYHYR
ncbi:hypothetical protein HanRHA438_Chr10g0475501 [Helianthus annuus]|nr:hypothetical protein HanIR_Chr10g0498891 [Helianthus annuus]KAJ0881552.1 hypothetical protein HanRHA438_Chr10g0475501 [Helianthus annuus]